MATQQGVVQAQKNELPVGPRLLATLRGDGQPEEPARGPRFLAAMRGDQRNVSAIAERGPYAGQAPYREGFQLISKQWEIDGEPPLVLHAGPRQASWTLSLRATEEANKGGHSRFAARRGSTYFDAPQVDFDFQAGNILPIPQVGGVTLAPGHVDFFRFMELLDQPPIVTVKSSLVPDALSIAKQFEGRPNYVTIHYNSLLFPMLVLQGFFEPDGLTWTDNAEDPANLSWSARFVVHHMSPDLWNTSTMVGTAMTHLQHAGVRFL